MTARWDPGGSFDRSLGQLRIRRLAGQGIVVGCRNLRRIAGAVAVGGFRPRDLGSRSRWSHIAALGDHADTVDRPGHLCRGKTVRGHDLGRCRRKVAGKMVEEKAGSLAEANDHILAGREKNIGHIEVVAIHTGEVAGYTKAFVLGSSPGWRLGCSHSCCLQRCCLGVDIGSFLLDSGEVTLVLCCVDSAMLRQKQTPSAHLQMQREKRKKKRKIYTHPLKRSCSTTKAEVESSASP